MMLMSLCSKRNSKLESHLKRTLPRHVYEDIRYYESCIVKQPKEGATFMYIILTGKAVLLAAYPFRGVKEAVSLRDVVSINVELDIPPFLKESEGHTCQHIRVTYKNNSLQSHILNLKIVKEEQEEVDESSINNGSESSIRERSVESDSQDEVSSFTKHINTDEESDVTKSDAKQKNHSRTDTSPKTKSAFSESKNQGQWDDSSSKSSSSTRDFSEDKLKKHIYGSRLAADVPDNRDSTGFVDQSSFPVHKLPEYRSVTRSSTVTPELRRSISSLLRRVQYSQPRPSRSYSSMTNYANSASPTMVASSEKRSQSVLERPRSNSDAKRHDWRILDPSPHLDDLHIYVLQAKPVLLNHLQYSWCAYLFDETLSISKTKHYANEICDTFLLENLYQQIKNEIMNQENSLENMYSLLHELELGLQGRSQLKYIFWKDQMLYHYIVQKLEMYIISSQFKHTIRGCNQELETDIYIEGRQDELEIAIAMLDILSTVLHDTDNIHDKIKMLNFRNGSLIQQLLSIITVSPRISPKFYNTCCRMLEDFNEFSTYAWRNLPEGGLISLSGTITNKVCGIISELLATIEKLAETNTNISVSMMFKDIYMENYLRRSITQLLGLLFPVEQKTVEPEESIIVYQHFFVLKYLMVNLPQVTDYIREHYQEELRFYIHWSRVNAKMPEKYPIKRILRPLVEHIHTIGSGQVNITVHSRRS